MSDICFKCGQPLGAVRISISGGVPGEWLHSDCAKFHVPDEIERLRALVWAAYYRPIPAGEGPSLVPCLICGYNGPGFYQPETHKCAADQPTDVRQEILDSMVDAVEKAADDGDATR